MASKHDPLQLPGILGKVGRWLSRFGADKHDSDRHDSGKQTSEEHAFNDRAPCCSESVHIAFRGKSDDRLYLAHGRQWQEVKYYQPYGLRVFCAQCRRRLL